jgi:predicted transcriptional regulator
MENEQSIFVEYFGNSPYVKVLDFLIDNQMFDYKKEEIMHNNEIKRKTFNKIWEKLLKKEIIIQTRTIGNAKLFKLNKKNPFVEKLIKFDWELTKMETAKLINPKFIRA